MLTILSSPKDARWRARSATNLQFHFADRTIASCTGAVTNGFGGSSSVSIHY
jgi:hypothetical protein